MVLVVVVDCGCVVGDFCVWVDVVVFYVCFCGCLGDVVWVLLVGVLC